MLNPTVTNISKHLAVSYITLVFWGTSYCRLFQAYCCKKNATLIKAL
jgi:hypothetical protein